jgi:hypothetical protein
MTQLAERELETKRWSAQLLDEWTDRLFLYQRE